ncbi:MAG: ABC transporter ATP-binding protein, partial [Sulfurimicrobium sp.]|nr:ABC transporter ATP-binding protein [Sulfurimicrobium sp.]
PTNHLDLDMRDALTLALEEYGGAMVLVSHDRSLIRATADELWLVAEGTAALFDGDLEDYRVWVESRRQAENAGNKPAVAEKLRRENAPRKKALLSKQVKLETELYQAQAELTEINRQLADPALYQSADAALAQNLNQQRENLEVRVAQLEEDWLELEMALEEAI